MPAYRFEEIAAMVRRGDVAAVDRAISSGWDVNRDDGFSATTALLVACEADRADVVALLLGHGADPNVRHRDNWNCYDSSRSRRVRELPSCTSSTASATSPPRRVGPTLSPPSPDGRSTPRP